MAIDMDEIMDGASDILEGAKDIVSDVVDGAGELLCDAGEMAQDIQEVLGKEGMEALGDGDFEEAIEQSDLPGETKEILQETGKAFRLFDCDFSKIGKQIGKLTVGLVKVGAGVVEGDLVDVVSGGIQVAEAGRNMWKSFTQVSDSSGNAQMRKMAQNA